MNQIALRPEQQALENAKGKIEPDDFKVLQNFINRNVKLLATDEVFTLRDKEGTIKAFKQRVNLSVEAGTLWKMWAGKQGNQNIYKFPVTAKGYDVIAEACGANVILPNSVIADGKEQPNPFVFRHKEGHIEAVYARAVAFKFSNKGIPQVVDWTTIFDLRTYRVVDLIAKAKDRPQAFQVRPAGVKPEDTDIWTQYVLDSSTSLWVNTTHPEALDWYKNITKREQKATDTAQTFARRNALKHLTGIQDCPTGDHDLTVICWRPTEGSMVKWDSTEYAQLQETVGKMMKGDVAQKKIEMQTGEDIIDGDEIESEVDPEDQEVVEIEGGPVEKQPPPTDPERFEKKPEKKLEPQTDEEKKLVREFKIVHSTFPEEYELAIFNLIEKGNFETGQEIGYPEMAAILKEVNRILDEGAS